MTKKYVLKPGRHQFAPGSPAVHDNSSLTDEEAGWYLERYPHIAVLFEQGSSVGKIESPEEAVIDTQEVKLAGDQPTPGDEPINNSITQ